MILIQKVESYEEIQKLTDCNAVQSIYKLVENSEQERIFRKCQIVKPSFWARLFGMDKLENYYYINTKKRKSLVMEQDIQYEHIKGRVGLTLQFTLSLDIQNSDSGKGLSDWLSDHWGCLYERQLTHLVQSSFKLMTGFFESERGLGLSQLRDGSLHFGPDVFRKNKTLPSWISVECDVIGAVEKMTETAIDRQNAEKQREETEQRHQEELDRLDRRQAELEAKNGILELEIKQAKLEAEKSDLKKQQQAKLLQTALDTLRPKKTPNLLIEGTPYPAKRLMLEVNGVRLELYAMVKATLGRGAPNSDVSVTIPEGAVEEKTRQKWCESISGRHAMLEWLGDTVRIQDLDSTNGMYVNQERQPSKETVFAGDARFRFSWDVRWQARVHACMKHCQLPCCDGCSARNVAALSLVYPGWTALYKLFIWECCGLKHVDTRLPDWRVVYRGGEEGAFYLLTSNGRYLSLRPGQKITEDDIVMSVKNLS